MQNLDSIISLFSQKLIKEGFSVHRLIDDGFLATHRYRSIWPDLSKEEIDNKLKSLYGANNLWIG